MPFDLQKIPLSTGLDHLNTGQENLMHMQIAFRTKWKISRNGYDLYSSQMLSINFLPGRTESYFLVDPIGHFVKVIFDLLDALKVFKLLTSGLSSLSKPLVVGLQGLEIVGHAFGLKWNSRPFYSFIWGEGERERAHRQFIAGLLSFVLLPPNRELVTLNCALIHKPLVGLKANNGLILIRHTTGQQILGLVIVWVK